MLRYEPFIGRNRGSYTHYLTRNILRIGAILWQQELQRARRKGDFAQRHKPDKLRGVANQQQILFLARNGAIPRWSSSANWSNFEFGSDKQYLPTIRPENSFGKF
jgi:hypothetical protein